MKKQLLLLLIPVLAFNLVGQAQGITDAERKAAIKNLKTTQKDLLSSIRGLSTEQLNFKSSPESWSIAECVEHIAISETNIFQGMIQGTLKAEATPEKRSEVKLSGDGVYDAIVDRTYKVKTQEAFVPTGKFGTHDATVAEFLNKRKANIEYLETISDDLHGHYFTFPVEALGTVDSYQLFYFMSGHSKRHTLQIEEVKSNAAFPAK